MPEIPLQIENVLQTRAAMARANQWTLENTLDRLDVEVDNAISTLQDLCERILVVAETLCFYF